MYSNVLLLLTSSCPELIINCIFPKASLRKFTQRSIILVAFQVMGIVIKKKEAGAAGCLL